MQSRRESMWKSLWCLAVGATAALFCWSCLGATNLWGLLVASLVFVMIGSVLYSGALGIARLIGEGDSWTILRHAGWAASLFTVNLLVYKSVSDGTETGFAGWLNQGSVFRCALRGTALGTLLGIQTAGSSRMEEDRTMQLREESAMHVRRLKAQV